MGLCKECIASQLGACRNLDYCRQEREALIEEAYQRARERGHTEWSDFVRWREGYSIFEAHCLACGMVVRIDVNPAIGEPDLSGEALFLDCPAAQTGQGTPPNKDVTSSWIA